MNILGTYFRKEENGSHRYLPEEYGVLLLSVLLVHSLVHSTNTY